MQEALTNSLKHAGPARAHVVVRYGQTDLELEITDNDKELQVSAEVPGLEDKDIEVLNMIGHARARKLAVHFGRILECEVQMGALASMESEN